jgi:hypothetical protein
MSAFGAKRCEAENVGSQFLSLRQRPCVQPSLLTYRARRSPSKYGLQYNDLRTAMHDPDRKTVLSAAIFSEAPDYGRLVRSLRSIDLPQHLALRTSALLEFVSGRDTI